MQTNEKICISGIGIVSPLGQRVDANRDALKNDVRATTTEIEGFKPADYIKRRYLRPLDDVTIRCIAMAGAAMQDAGVNAEDIDASRVGIVIGSMFAGIGCIFDFKKTCYEGKKDDYIGLSPLYFPGIVFNSLSGQPAIEYGYTGPNAVVNAGFSSGLLAVIKGAEYIRSGKADIVIAGGAEMSHPFIKQKFAVQKSTPKVAWMGPDFQHAEAVCLFVLHRENDARFANSKRYATLDAWRYGFFSGGCSAQSVAGAIASIPGFDKERLGAIAMDSYDGSPSSEQEEQGMRALLASHDPIYLRNKKNFGHTLGASGSLNLFQAVMNVHEQDAARPSTLVSSLDPGGNYAFLTLRSGNDND